MIKSVSIIGAGFVGLVMAVCFAEKGFRVYVYDVDEGKLDDINRGKPPFYEPKVEQLLRRALRKGLFKCTDVGYAVLNSNVTFIAVGTPSQPDGGIDLTFIRQSVEDVGHAIARKKAFHLVVVKSTVVPGTTGGLVKDLIEEYSGKKAGEGFGLCMCPEFLHEGGAVYDTFHTDRIVIGEYDEKSGQGLERFYRAFYGKNCAPILRMNLASAEMVKYASNAFLALKISFINEIAKICELVSDVNVTEIARGVGLDSRIGPLFLNAGLGWGGSCFHKDVKALIKFAQSRNYEPRILKSALQVNDDLAGQTVELAKSLIGDLKGRRVALLGLSFKPNSSDIREAASLRVINRLLDKDAKVVAYDPVAMPEVNNVLHSKIEYVKSALDSLKDAECCILVTEWDEFRRLRPEDFRSLMKNPVVIDGRNIFNSKDFSRKLVYRAVGLGPITKAEGII